MRAGSEDSREPWRKGRDRPSAAVTASKDPQTPVNGGPTRQVRTGINHLQLDYIPHGQARPW